jgi:hypothetical protein
VLAAVLASTLLVALAGGIRWLDGLPEGLEARYVDGLDATKPPARATIDRRPATRAVVDAWSAAPPETFTVTWSGAVLAVRGGRYTFGTTSDDGSHVFIDNRLVVDNGGGHKAELRTGDVTLDPGVHSIRIDFDQQGGVFEFDLSWARDGGPLAPVPDWALAPREVSFGRFLISLGWRHSLPLLQWIWVGTLVLGAGAIAVRLAKIGVRRLVAGGAGPALAYVVAGSFLFNVTALWWGLPNSIWAPDEMTPGIVLDALSQHFSHGWYDRYPPFHYYLLTAAYSPLLLLDWLGRIDLGAAAPSLIAIVIGRLVTIAMGVGTVLAAYVCGAHAFGKRAGVFAAAIVALIAPFVYYAKTANVDVPFFFWVSVSFVFYVRLRDSWRTSDLVLFAVTATLAICTKDQAYGLYLLAPVALVARRWRSDAAAGRERPFARALTDRGLLLAGVMSIVLFAIIHNLLFNWRGFYDHVWLLTHGASQSYRAVEPTLSGRLELVAITGGLVQLSHGWPLLIVSLAGGVMAWSGSSRRYCAWLLLPVLAYYAGFIDVILYNYDRFMLPVCFVLALFGGLALDRFLGAPASHTPWRIAAVTAVFAYSALYSGTVDDLMLADSRYEARRWFEANASPGDVIGSCFGSHYLPDFRGYRNPEICTTSDLHREAPKFFVLNADYARAVPPDTPNGDLIAGLERQTLGYRRVARFRQRSMFAWLPGAHRDLVGPRLESAVFSTLRHIDPTIDVYLRSDR